MCSPSLAKGGISPEMREEGRGLKRSDGGGSLVVDSSAVSGHPPVLWRWDGNWTASEENVTARELEITGEKTGVKCHAEVTGSCGYRA